MSAKENLYPAYAIIQAVAVVPRFAPIMTPMDSLRVKSLAFTKLTTITVVAELDWIMVVTPNPDNMPLTLLPVIECIIALNLSPLNACREALINFIPKRNKPKLPKT